VATGAAWLKGRNSQGGREEQKIVHERRRITKETALRLARYFNTNAEFWLNLQNFFDLEVTRRSGKISEIERQVHPAPALVS